MKQCLYMIFLMMSIISGTQRIGVLMTTLKKNFDMSTARFMSNKGLWPEDRMESTAKKWYHSDYKTLSYQYTYEFYNRIVDLSK